MLCRCRLALMGPHVMVRRCLADLPGQVIRGNEVVETTVRVRRTRPSDLTRVLRWLHEQSRIFTAPKKHSAAATRVLEDYAARALAQGHSVLAEQQMSCRGGWQVRGLALAGAVCPWDPALLKKWARMVRCPQARRFILLTAHSLEAPQLHTKHNVHRILQVFLVVPVENPQREEILRSLAQTVIQRGREMAFPIVRFDVANGQVANVMEEIQLQKEWYISFNAIKEDEQGSDGIKVHPDGYFLAVYTSHNPDGLENATENPKTKNTKI